MPARIQRLRGLSMDHRAGADLVGVYIARHRHGGVRRALDGVPIAMYRVVRYIHLLLETFAPPSLTMYGDYAVQMSLSAWFNMQPAEHERYVAIDKGATDARAIARDLMDRT